MLSIERGNGLVQAVASFGRRFRAVVGRNGGRTALDSVSFAERHPWDEEPEESVESRTEQEAARALLVRAIQERNPSADAAFLDRFGDRDLERYLEHLRDAAERGRGASWQRAGCIAAVGRYVCNLRD